MRDRHRLKLVFIAVLLTALVAAHAAASDVCMTKADEAMSAARSWRDLRVWFDTYAECDDGYIAEGLSEIVTHMLATEWTTLPALRLEMRQRPRYRDFVLRHIDATTNSSDLEAIVRNARTRCPRGAASLCSALNARAERALREQ